MSAPTFLLPAQLRCPVALAPRRRAIDPNVARTLEAWIRSALHVAAEASVRLSEWVSMDSRAVSHRVYVFVGTGTACRCFVLEKASERIFQADVHGALGSQGLRAHARDAAPA
ncbi:MAG: hypothetical protein FJ207_04295 [Gemmatimonadetes bacterium]|nr:hypothetical protein [Gemmatimonadota bacterium]